MAHYWWDDPAVFEPLPPEEQHQGCAAGRMWRAACRALSIAEAESSWQLIVDSAPADTLWHSLRNCVAYQAGVWQNLISKGMVEVLQPAAFKMAIVLRHTPPDVAARMITELLEPIPEGRDLISYILALLTDDEALTEERDEELLNRRMRAAAISDDSAEDSDIEAEVAESMEAEPAVRNDMEAEASRPDYPLPDSSTSRGPTIEPPVSEAIVTSTTVDELIDGFLEFTPASSRSSSRASWQARRNASPQGRESPSPGRGSPSLGRRESPSPGRGSPSPGRGSASPGRGSPQPGHESPSPGRGSDTPPGRVSVSPGRRSATPGRGSASSGRDSASSGRESSSSGRDSASQSRESRSQSRASESSERESAAPKNDLQLFGDLELAVLAASRLEYDAHAKLVRAEYSSLAHNRYLQLRIKVLNQFTGIPKLYHTTEFECFEAAARENITREIATLTEHLASRVY